MEFGLSDEQRMLADSVRRWADQSASPEQLKTLADAGHTDGQELLPGLAALGTLGIMIDEHHGGSGMTLLDACLVQQALGRNAVPTPWTASAILAPLALAAADASLASAWLPRLAAGEARLGVGLADAVGARPDTGITLDARDRASGVTRFVIDGPGADAWIVTAGRDTLLLVEADADGAECVALPTIDRTRRVGELTLKGTPVVVLGRAGQAAPAIARLLAAGRTALAFDALGAAERMLERAVDYALERKQFGRVIGSFQAVKHLCAEMAADLEPCHSLLWYAAYADAAYPDEFELMACHAKAHMGDVGRQVARTTTEAHGGMGFTHEMGLHYFFKRIGLDRQLLGNPDVVRQHAAALQGWSRAG